MILTATLGHSAEGRRHALPALRGASAQCLIGEITCVSDKIRALYAWWRNAGDDLPPAWSQFDVTEHKRIVPNLFLAKRAAPNHWVFTLKGEAVQALLPSGSLPEAIADLDDIEESTQLIAYYEDVAQSRRCHLVRGTVTNDRGDQVDIESIDCPFIGGAAAGITILGILECVAVRPSRETAI